MIAVHRVSFKKYYAFFDNCETWVKSVPPVHTQIFFESGAHHKRYVPLSKVKMFVLWASAL
jgi:hypothetical protein